MATYATMGWIGFVKFGTTIVRATSCDIKTSQEISYPEVVDGRADQTIYQMGPKVTGGSCAFPLIHDTATGSCNNPSTATLASNSVAANLWALVTARDINGRLTAFNTTVRYANNLAYLYPNCYLNSLGFTIAQSAEIQCTGEVFGNGASTASGGGAVTGTMGDRTDDPSVIDNTLNYLAPARVATWNDVNIALVGMNGSNLLGQEMREFTVTVMNNLERFYTLNGSLSPFDVAPKKREISGTLKIIGNNQVLSQWTDGNDTRFTSKNQIAFGFKVGSGSTCYWATGLNGIILEIEEVAISTGLFETSTKWRATSECDTVGGYDATFLGTSNVAAFNATTAETAYGLSTLKVPVYTNNGI